jgi:quercetin 2,3-dioxygenase
MSLSTGAAAVHHLRYEQLFPGLRGVNIFASDYAIEPFLVFTEYFMEQQVFGPHPHAGISVMTYLLPDSEESFINRDSNGDFSVIEPGGLHITQAGSGVHHDEFPKTPGKLTHGFQIWINHAGKDRMVSPKAMHAKPSDIPEQISDDSKVRVLHGQFNGLSPAYRMVTDVTLLHVFLKPGKSILLPADKMAFAYILKGSGTTGSGNLAGQSLVVYDGQREHVQIEALKNGLEFMFGTGKPLDEPIVYGGPFVMTTKEQMEETKRRHGRGEMGTLLPYQE